MRFLVDECLFRQIVEALRAAGHDVTWVRQDCRGFDDEAVLAKAVQEDRILVSEDRDFGTLTVRLGRPAIGIVIVAASEFPLSLQAIAEHVAIVVTSLGDRCKGSLTTIEPGRVRQRDLPPKP